MEQIPTYTILYQGEYWRLKPKRKGFLNHAFSRLRRKLGHKFHHKRKRI